MAKKSGVVHAKELHKKGGLTNPAPQTSFLKEVGNASVSSLLAMVLVVGFASVVGAASLSAGKEMGAMAVLDQPAIHHSTLAAVSVHSQVLGESTTRVQTFTTPPRMMVTMGPVKVVSIRQEKKNVKVQQVPILVNMSMDAMVEALANAPIVQNWTVTNNGTTLCVDQGIVVDGTKLAPICAKLPKPPKAKTPAPVPPVTTEHSNTEHPTTDHK